MNYLDRFIIGLDSREKAVDREIDRLNLLLIKSGNWGTGYSLQAAEEGIPNSQFNGIGSRDEYFLYYL